MADPQLHIENLHVRIPGGDRSAGEHVAAGIRESLSELPLTRSRELGALHLRVEVPHGATEAETLRAIQTALIRALRQE